MNMEQGRDAILGLFNDGWDRRTPVLYDDLAGEPPKQGPWVRVTVRHGDGFQGSLSGDTGKRRWRRTGIVTVQLFTPFGRGQVVADQLAAVAEQIFQEAPSGAGVWFRRTRVQELGKDGAYFVTNVLANFEYDEVR